MCTLARCKEPENDAASRMAHPIEEQPGTPRNRTGEFRLQLVRGGSMFAAQLLLPVLLNYFRSI
jgi:hypothetical protein